MTICDYPYAAVLSLMAASWLTGIFMARSHYKSTIRRQRNRLIEANIMLHGAPDETTRAPWI